MPRVKRGVNAHQHREKILKATKGFKWGRKSKERAAKEALLHAWSRAFRGRKEKRASLPPALDRQDQRGHPPRRDELQHIHRGAQGCRHQDRPKDFPADLAEARTGKNQEGGCCGRKRQNKKKEKGLTVIVDESGRFFYVPLGTYAVPSYF